MHVVLLFLGVLCFFAGATIATTPARSPCRPTSPVQGAEKRAEPANLGVELERMLSNLSTMAISSKEEKDHPYNADIEEVDMLASEKNEAAWSNKEERPSMYVFGRARSMSQHDPMYAFEYTFNERKRHSAEEARKRPLPLEETRNPCTPKEKKSIFKKKKHEDRPRRFMQLFKGPVTPADDASPTTLRFKKRRL